MACDEALAPGAQMVLALRVVCGLSIAADRDATSASRRAPQPHASPGRRGRSARLEASSGCPDAVEREARLPVVLACVAGMFTVAHRAVLEPRDPLADLGRQALSIADALVAAVPRPTPRCAVCAPWCGWVWPVGRAGSTTPAVALTLDDVDRSRWNASLLRAGLDDATYAASGSGRFALEAAISGAAQRRALGRGDRLGEGRRPLHRARAGVALPRCAGRAAHLPGQLALSVGGELGPVEAELETLAAEGPSYARRDAAFALADLSWRTGRRDEAAARYRELATTATSDAVRRFCEGRGGG